MNKLFRQRMKRLREKQGLSRRDLKKKSLVPYAIIYALEEYEDKEIYSRNAIKLARALNVSINYFLTGKEFVSK